MIKWVVDLCQFFTCESVVCSGAYPAAFGEGTRLTVLGKITAIKLNVYLKELTVSVSSATCDEHALFSCSIFSVKRFSGVKMSHLH